MLRTNSKQARENLRRYIMDNFDASNYTDNPPEDWPGIARFILDTYREEKYYSREYMIAHRIPEIYAFVEWCAGLPSVLDTCYYYNRSAVEDLGLILEETDAEKARFTESQAEDRLSRLIYAEIVRGCK